MTPDDMVDRLASLPLFALVPRKDLEWLAKRGEMRAHGSGTVLRERGAPVEEMLILLGGRMAAYAAKGGGLHKIFEAGVGEVVGVVPYSRMQKAPANLVVEDDAIAFTLHRTHFPGLIRECPDTTAALVHQMLDRAKGYRTAELDDDRIQSVSRLASGLAHELNNPAAAAARDAQSLAGLLDEAEETSSALAAARLSDAQIEAINAVRASCAVLSKPQSALEAVDREDDIVEWLQRHELNSKPAEALAESDVSLAELDRLAAVLPQDSLGIAIHWMAILKEARDAAGQIQTATHRIHALVRAVKGFTFMDREGVPEEVDVERGILDTLVVLESKARAKSLDISLEAADDLPHIYGFGSEINQVWHKLIENAIDAVAPGGKVIITATSRKADVVVRVVDNGPGIPDEHRSRVFDPFFTTKPVGSGTGLGLDYARRIIHLHHGDIDFNTQPGETAFRVRLPISRRMIDAR